MKIFVAAIAIAAFLLNSCEPAATFDKPQPVDVKSLGSFPARLQGNYLSVDQASLITISDKLITRHYDFEHKEHKDSLDSSYKLIGDTLLNLAEGTREKVLLKGDTVIQHANWTDTLFSISAGNVLKKLKGFYFLNNLYDDKSWEVNKLSLQRGKLTISSISGKDDIQKLKELTETSYDTTSVPFSLTRREFKRFVRQGGFGEGEEFTRVKNIESD